MILLLSCFTGWSQNDTIVTKDSVVIAISALKVANAKMIELKYEKEINKNLQEIIIADSIIISNLNNDIVLYEKRANNAIHKAKRQRNKAIAIGSGTSIVLFILLIVAL